MIGWLALVSGPWAWGFDGLLQKAGPALGLSMGLDKPITDLRGYKVTT
jgi:hypothetical protein